MAIVDQGLAAWLKSEGLYSTAEDAAAVARWGERAVVSEFMSPLALKSSADSEAGRQLDFLGGPLAKDEHTIVGLWSSLVGQVIALQGDRYGYEVTPSVFVLRAAESETADLTTITVLYRMPDTVRTRALTLPYFDFTSNVMPAGTSLKRASTGTYIDFGGVLRTAPVDGPRFEYAPGGVPLGILIEPQGANLAPTSTPLTLVRMTRTAGIDDPAGGTDAARYAVATANDPSAQVTVQAAPSGRTFTRSCYLRNAVMNGLAPRALLFDYGATGTESIGSASVTTSAAWARYSATRAFPAGMNSTAIVDRFDPFDGTGGTNAPAVGSSMDTAFWQYEEGATATSYILPGQTRAADALSFDWGSQGIPDGAWTFRVTFDDISTQDIAMTVAGGLSTLPTNLTRPRVFRVQLLR